MDIAVRLDGGNLVGFWKNDFATVDGSISSVPAFDAGEIRAVGIFDEATPPLTRPASSQWDFLGVGAGEPIYILPASGSPNTLPFLGFSTEDSSVASFDDIISFQLTGFSGPTGSTFNLYVSSSSIFMTGTSSSLTGPGINLEIGDHQHYNWAFSHMGVYDLTFSYSGELGTTTYTGSDTFRFEIIPEPGSSLFVLLGIGYLILRRKRWRG